MLNEKMRHTDCDLFQFGKLPQQFTRNQVKATRTRFQKEGLL
jgi:hypothetical protein